MFVWMCHRDHGGHAQFDADVAERWQAMGWEPCDPPAEPDLTKDPSSASSPEPAPAAPAPPAPSSESTPRRRRGSDTQE